MGLRMPKDKTQRERRDRPGRDSRERYNAFAAILLCLRDPRVVADFGAGGPLPRPLFLQLGGIFVAVGFVSGAFEVSLAEFGLESAVVWGIVIALCSVLRLLMLAVALLLVAWLAVGNAGYRKLLGGLTLVHILGAIVMAGLTLAALVVSSGTRGLAEAPVVRALISFAVFLFYMSIYVSGLGDLGCLTSLGLSFIVVLAGQGLRSWFGNLLLCLLDGLA